jgi:hypothetical protein
LISESLIFPYRDGVRFTYALMKSGGRQQAFAGVFKNPPRTTREILSPTAYLSHEMLPSLTLPDLSPTFKNKYETYDVGSVGQFDIGVLARQFGDDLLARRLSPQWRGGIYWAVVPKGKLSTKRTGDIGIVYLSRWSSAKSAAEFAKFYGSTLPRRFGRVRGGPQQWQTDEGDISVETHGEYVIVLESFDAATNAAVRASILEDLSNSRKSTAANSQLPPVEGEDVSIRVARPLHEYGGLVIADYLHRELNKRVSH